MTAVIATVAATAPSTATIIRHIYLPSLDRFRWALHSLGRCGAPFAHRSFDFCYSSHLPRISFGLSIEKGNKCVFFRYYVMDTPHYSWCDLQINEFMKRTKINTNRFSRLLRLEPKRNTITNHRGRRRRTIETCVWTMCFQRCKTKRLVNGI